MPKVSGEYRQGREAHIRDAARRCFVRNGFHQTSMQDIQVEAKLSSGGIYRYFASKDDIIVAIATENLEGVVGTLTEAIAAHEVDNRPEAALADLLEASHSNQADRQFAHVALMVWSEALLNAALAEHLRDALATMSEALAGLVRQQRSTTDAVQTVPAEAVSDLLVALLPGFLLNVALGREATTARLLTALRDKGVYGL